MKMIWWRKRKKPQYFDPGRSLLLTGCETEPGMITGKSVDRRIVCNVSRKIVLMRLSDGTDHIFVPDRTYSLFDHWRIEAAWKYSDA